MAQLAAITFNLLIFINAWIGFLQSLALEDHQVPKKK